MLSGGFMNHFSSTQLFYKISKIIMKKKFSISIFILCCISIISCSEEVKNFNGFADIHNKPNKNVNKFYADIVNINKVDTILFKKELDTLYGLMQNCVNDFRKDTDDVYDYNKELYQCYLTLDSTILSNVTDVRNGYKKKLSKQEEDLVIDKMDSYGSTINHLDSLLTKSQEKFKADNNYR